MNTAPQHFRDLTEDEIARALDFIDPDCDRLTWARMGMAVKHELGLNGFSIWDAWSQKGSSYNATDARDAWKSFKTSGSKGTVTIGTLIAEAQLEGFKFDSDEKRTPISQEEIERRARERQEREEAAAAEAAEARAKAAEKANEIWNAARDIEGDDHPYLQRKGVLAHGVRVGAWKGQTDALLIPMRNADGEIVSLQAISSNPDPTVGRAKDFLWNGQKFGTWHWVGDHPSGSTIIMAIAEGYATAASIHMATGYSVAVAWDAGNLRNVALSLREKYPQATIIIAAENDKWNKSNAGMQGGKQATHAARGLLVAPVFKDESTKPTDFNDLHQLEGLDAVRWQINGVLPQPANDNDDQGSGPITPLDSPINTFGYPHLTDKHQPLNTVENLEHLLTQYGITARYNQTRKEKEVTLPGRDYTLDNRANCSLAELKSICVRNRMPQANLEDYIKLIADRNAYNPVAEWITSKPWDGVSRIQQLLDTVKTSEANTWLKERLMYRWLLSAVASMFMPVGFVSHGCLVFAGAQGKGKTAWVMRLAPVEMDLVQEGATLDPNNKDSVGTVIGHWIVELGELDATFRKADIARLKAFVTQRTDKLRRPYDRVDSHYQRRTVFCATVNDKEYLVDDTGNRRWWTIVVEWIDYQHDIDMQQLWAEILLHHQRGEQHHLTKEEHDALEVLNGQHMKPNALHDLIAGKFQWDNPLRNTNMSASEVLIEIGYKTPTNNQAKEAGAVLRKLAGEPSKSGGRLVWKMPPQVRHGHNQDDVRPF